MNPEQLETLISGVGLENDIKLPWEFSRGYAFVLQAARAPSEKRKEIAAEIAEKIRLWQEHNRDLDGPNWICAMEVAIRAINWICADVLLDGELGRAVGERQWLEMLWTCAQVIEQRLEARRVSSNHYLADLLGLYVLGSLFDDLPQGRRWRRFAFREFPTALLRQTYSDGGLDEASLPYHALVTEMALLFALFTCEPLPPRFRDRLLAMCRVLAALRDVDGDVFQIGDNDSGRVLALDFVSAGPGRADFLLRLAEIVFPDVSFERPDQAVFPRSGWWICRRGPFEAVLEFGGNGMAGHGAHAHNDTLSVVVNYRGQRVLVDPGTYLYTSDPAARNLFRSSRVHNVLRFDDREPCPLPEDLPGLFRLPGSDRPCRLLGQGEGWVEAQAREESLFRWTRKVEVQPDEVTLTDNWHVPGPRSVSWNFSLAPDVTASTVECGRARLRVANAELELTMEPAQGHWRIVESAYSPGYGRKVSSKCLRIEIRDEPPKASTRWRLRVV